jgi:hypothetical protein
VDLRIQDAPGRNGSAHAERDELDRQDELYMEYPPLVAQQNARFAVHLTRLGDFKALNDGRPSLEFTPDRSGTT